MNNVITILPFVTDIITAINVILIFGSAFLLLEILMSLGGKGGYVLARGLWFFMPAVVIIAAIRIYDFFVRYTPVTAFIRELLYLFFTALLFIGLFIQFLAIRGAIERRM